MEWIGRLEISYNYEALSEVVGGGSNNYQDVQGMKTSMNEKLSVFESYVTSFLIISLSWLLLKIWKN